MRTRTQIMIVLLVAVVGALVQLSKWQTPDSVEEQPGETRGKRMLCESFVLRGLGVIGLVGSALGDAMDQMPAQQRNQLERCIQRQGDLEGVAKCMGARNRAVFDELATASLLECMRLPDELVICLEQMDLESPVCREAYERFEGLTDSIPETLGPALSWKTSLSALPRALMLEQDLAVVATQAGVQAFEQGRRQWELAMPNQGAAWLTTPSPGLLLTADDTGTLLALTLTTGQEVWREQLVGPHGEPTPALAAQGPHLITSANEWIEVRAAGCPGPSCLHRRQTALPTHFAAESLQIMGDKVYVTSGDSLASLAPDGSLRFFLIANHRIGRPAAWQDDLFLTVDEGVVRLKPSQCSGTISGGQVPAAGHCVQWRIDVGSAVSREPPVVLSAEHLLVSSAGDLLSLRGGDVQWRTRFGLVGELKPGGEGAVLALGGGDLLSQLELRQVDVSTGRSRWRTHLPLDASTTPSAVLWTHANGQTLVAGHGSLVALHGMKAAPDPGNGQAESKGRRPRR